MTNDIYTATSKGSNYTYIFEADRVLTQGKKEKFIGHKGDIAIHSSGEIKYHKEPYPECEWTDCKIKLATAEETQWYYACKAADKLVDKPILKDSFPIF